MRNKGSGGTDKATLWFIVGFVAIAVVVVIYAGVSSGGFATSTQPGFVATTAAPITNADWVRGSASATVSVIEYGDYECPACEDYEPMVSQMLADYGSRIMFAFRNFPLYSVHPLAGIAAQAAEAAGLQGKFWEMHDLLYASSSWSQWTTSAPGQVVGKYFDGYAQSLGLDVTRFDKDLNSSDVTNKVAADVTSGNNASIDHTPIFFVNNKQIQNPASYAEFKAAIDAALASSTAASAGSGSPAPASATPSGAATASSSGGAASATFMPLAATSTPK